MFGSLRSPRSDSIFLESMEFSSNSDSPSTYSLSLTAFWTYKTHMYFLITFDRKLHDVVRLSNIHHPITWSRAQGLGHLSVLPQLRMRLRSPENKRHAGICLTPYLIEICNLNVIYVIHFTGKMQIELICPVQSVQLLNDGQMSEWWCTSSQW